MTDPPAPGPTPPQGADAAGPAIAPASKVAAGPAVAASGGDNGAAVDLMVLPVKGVPGDDADGNTLLKVTGLTKHYAIRREHPRPPPAGSVRAVDGIGFAVKQGQLSGWSASPAAANRPPTRLVLKRLPATAGRIEFDQREDLARGRRTPGACAGTCRSCSRIPTPRSTRA